MLWKTLWKKYEERRRGLYSRKAKHLNFLQGKEIWTGLHYFSIWSNGRWYRLAWSGLITPVCFSSLFATIHVWFRTDAVWRKQTYFHNFNAATIFSGATDWYRTDTKVPRANHLLPRLFAQNLVTHLSPGAPWLRFKLQSLVIWQLVENGLAPCRPCLVYSGLGIWGFFSRVYLMIDQLHLQLYTSAN